MIQSAIKFIILISRFILYPIIISVRSGANTITRSSTDSSVTIPFERSFRDLSVRPQDQNTDGAATFNFCGCGWPQHMLVPKGTAQGAAYQVFAMVSNIDLDTVRIDYFEDFLCCKPVLIVNCRFQIQQTGTEGQCNDASSFCGLKDQLYPDRRDMGYPFDRPPNAQFNAIEDFLQPNMALQDITIRFTDRTVQNPKNPRS